MRHFGTTSDGRDVHAVDIAAGGISATVLTYGAILQDLRLDGVDHRVTIGSDSLSDYEAGMGYYGAIVAPVANRLRNAQAPIAGRIHQFEANQGGRHILHSASCGTHLKVWEIRECDATCVTLGCDLPDREGGFPGNRRIEARFEVRAPMTLRMTLRATTDAPTLMNPVNHSYWNLDGSQGWAGHHLKVAARDYLPADDDILPTGEIVPVAGTRFDFRQGREITPADTELDHNLCLDGGKTALRDVLWLRGTSGLSMTFATTEPGVQIFDGRAAGRPGDPVYQALAIEAQGWPDAPNNPAFPSITLEPGNPYEQITEWRFTPG